MQPGKTSTASITAQGSAMAVIFLMIPCINEVILIISSKKLCFKT
jgi:hypothetical protein